MAITFNYHENPVASDLGLPATEAVSIYSDLIATHWEVRRKDRQGTSFTVAANAIPTTNVVSVSRSKLKVILSTRTKYQVRIRYNQAWQEWVDFKTKDKRYDTPSAINDVDTEVVPKRRGAAVIVTNNAVQNVVNTNRGATVTNTKRVYNDVSTITITGRGATIVTR